MKFLIVLAAIVAITASAAVDSHQKVHDDFKERLLKIHKQCQEDPEVHVDSEILLKLRNKEHVDESVLVKLATCTVKALGYLKDNGEINAELLKENLLKRNIPADKADAVVNKCVKDNNVVHFWRCVGKFRDHHDNEYDV